MKPTPRKSLGRVGAASPYASIGVQIATTMVVCVTAGLLVDRRLGTEPWLVVSGAVIGVIFVFVRLLYVRGSVYCRSEVTAHPVPFM